MREERQWLVPRFWKKYELQTQLSLSYLKVEPADANWITADLLRRFSHIKAELPVDAGSPVYMRFAMMALAAIEAEQHLFAARFGRVPGEFASGPTPAGIPNVDHPFLRAFRNALSELEKEARAGRRTN